MNFDPQRQQPSEVICYLNAKCNARCAFCLRQKSGYAKTPDLTADTLRVVLDAFPRIGSACIAGFGEPLLAPTLGEVLELCAERNLYSGVITNGSVIDEVYDTVPLHLAHHVTISVNGWDAKSHGQLCGIEDIRDRVEAGVTTLGSLSVPVIASFVVGKRRAHRAREMIGYAADLGISQVYLLNELFHGGPGDQSVETWLREEVITFDDTEALNEIKEATRFASELGVTVGCAPQPIQRDHNPRRCLSPFTRIGIDGNGDITGCIRVIPPDRSTGNILEEGPLVWSTSKHLRGLRSGLAGAGPLQPECRYCFGAWIRG